MGGDSDPSRSIDRSVVRNVGDICVAYVDVDGDECLGLHLPLTQGIEDQSSLIGQEGYPKPIAGLMLVLQSSHSALTLTIEHPIATPLTFLVITSTLRCKAANVFREGKMSVAETVGLVVRCCGCLFSIVTCRQVGRERERMS